MFVGESSIVELTAGPTMANRLFCSYVLSLSGVSVSCLQWNPSLQHSSLLAVALSTGSLHLLSVKEDVSVLFQDHSLNTTSRESLLVCQSSSQAVCLSRCQDVCLSVCLHASCNKSGLFFNLVWHAQPCGKTGGSGDSTHPFDIFLPDSKGRYKVCTPYRDPYTVQL